MTLIETVVETLETAGIELQLFHAESAPDQYEFVLGALPPLEAVDTLVAAREIVASAAASAGLRATMYPKPFKVSHDRALLPGFKSLKRTKFCFETRTHG